MSWPTRPLGELCTLEIGKTPSRANPEFWRDGALPWLSIADMNQGRQLRTTKERVTDAGAKAARMKLLLPGTIVLSYKLSIGKVGFVQIPMFTNEAIAALTSIDASVHPDYMYWALQHMDLLEGADRAAMGNTLNKAKLERLRVPLPPLPEQRRIAAILDKADALRAKRREAIAKLDQLLQSVFIDMFGDPATNPRGWPRRSLSNVGRVQTGGTPPSSMTDMFDGPIPFVTPGDLGGLVDLSRRTVTREGALLSRVAPAGSTLVCCIGATIGKMGFAKIDCAFNQQINSVTWNEDVLPRYGYYALRRLAPDIAHRGASTTLPILKKSEFEKLLITVPPMSMQKKFSDAAEVSEDQMRMFSESNERLDMLFLSLQADMFLSGAP